jgi:omega-amidase
LNRARVVSEAGEGEEIIYADIGECLLCIDGCDSWCADPAVLESTRGGIPVTVQRRFDVYRDVAN